MSYLTERQQWGSPLGLSAVQQHVGLPALDPRSAKLHGESLPRGAGLPRLTPDRRPTNYWMSPAAMMRYAYQPGDIILGRIGNTILGSNDDRPLVTDAMARSGKTSTVLVPNLFLYRGSVVVLDPKGELVAETADVRRAQGHDVHVLDPFGVTGERSAQYNALAELDPESPSIIDDVTAIAQAIVVEEKDAKSKHWTLSAQALVTGVILHTLRLPPEHRHMVTVRQLLTLMHPWLIAATRRANSQGELFGDASAQGRQRRAAALDVLLSAMASAGGQFGGILAGIGQRFKNTPKDEMGSILSTAIAQTAFLDSLPMRDISKASSFNIADLRGDRPTTIYLCLSVGQMETHSRWLRLFVQQACVVLERLGLYPRGRTPILFMMEEFPTLGHMEIMERAAAFFPGFGIKLWAVMQDLTQLERYYNHSWETFLGNAGVLQFFANGDQTTLSYLSNRLERLIMPFELRTALSRSNFSQLLLIEGEPPAAAVRLEHYEVEQLRENILRRARMRAIAR